ncbi:MAG: hypothetical protein C4542_07295 [Dehalococcoidia bacterium]|nr:MAG: hypothetical protein C4542_07295 [Dehalococcoidia bacterium]
MPQPEFMFDEASHTYWLGDDKLPGVTSILKAAGLLEFPHSNGSAMLKGTYIHRATELYDRDDLDADSLDAEIKPYLEGWMKFRKDSGFVPELIEAPMFHPHLFYAGTIDRYGVLNGKKVLLDIKSGSPHPAYKVQVAGGYEGLLIGNGHHIDKFYSLYLKNTGGYSLQEITDAALCRKTFLCALTLYRWKESHL